MRPADRARRGEASATAVRVPRQIHVRSPRGSSRTFLTEVHVRSSRTFLTEVHVRSSRTFLTEVTYVLHSGSARRFTYGLPVPHVPSHTRRLRRLVARFSSVSGTTVHRRSSRRSSESAETFRQELPYEPVNRRGERRAEPSEPTGERRVEPREPRLRTSGEEPCEPTWGTYVRNPVRNPRGGREEPREPTLGNVPEEPCEPSWGTYVRNPVGNPGTVKKNGAPTGKAGARGGW